MYEDLLTNNKSMMRYSIILLNYNEVKYYILIFKNSMREY